ncbi:hypothetical protein J2W51_003869 [Tardiphaga robiniae]|uniref:hypothetical protein n=1 Tax=Tardiphaga robiniae TaxID=943830 RepID=UPI00285860BA|nr:hypothetical protein [Tardiphaga robiniae]MDR6661283.1 hypothetical protein [Tardiphaga robiniae]
MTVSEFDVGPIARALNVHAASYAIGGLQDIRKRLRGYSKRPSSDIFTSQTIRPHWAFHYGGRTELQFNIGLEDIAGEPALRHGVAFSFEPSQSLPSIDVLVPKVGLFNDYLRGHPEAFPDMRMWHYRGRVQSSDYPASPIMTDLVVPGPFVFLGKRQRVAEIDYDVILADFDRLLPLYEYVESGGHESPSVKVPKAAFSFQAGCSTDRPSGTTASLAERVLNISLRHNLMQAALTCRLIAQYGAANVADEHASGSGTKIDVVLQHAAGEFWYYEIKTAHSPRACIRDAIGQIMEYSYWPGAHEASRLIICGEAALDDEGAAYLRQLNERFRLPFAYEQIVLEQ